MKTLWIILLITYSNNAFCESWEPEERNLYGNGKFLELRQVLLQKKQYRKAQIVKRLELDMQGCRRFKSGVDHILPVIQCMRAIEEEIETGVSDRSKNLIVSDLNRACEILAHKKGGIEKLLEERVIPKAKNWNTCHKAVWAQVYLTAYANFDARPVWVLNFVRRSERLLPAVNPWASKIRRLLAGT